MDENMYEDEKEDLDEEIDLEEILSELELDEGDDSKDKKVDEAKEEDLDEVKDKDEKSMDEAKDEDLDEAKKDEEDKLDEMEVNYKAETANRMNYKAEYVHEGNENFDLDALLEEINNLDETEETEEITEVTDVILQGVAGLFIGGTPLIMAKAAWDVISDDSEKVADYTRRFPKIVKLMTSLGILGSEARKVRRENFNEGENKPASEDELANMEKALSEEMGENSYQEEMDENSYQEEIHELNSALEVKTNELNEVNLLNSKLLYVNRIFKANDLDQGQKLRVVETLDNASNIKEAKLIYETIKDTFTVANATKKSFKTKTKSLREGLGMASKTSGTTQSNARKEVITESDNMVNRFKKLANIKINQ
jgi:hypothetical protein